MNESLAVCKVNQNQNTLIIPMGENSSVAGAAIQIKYAMKYVIYRNAKVELCKKYPNLRTNKVETK